MTDLALRRLEPDDAPAYVELRGDMLRDAPQAFLSDPEDDRGSDVDGLRETLAGDENAIIGAFVGTRLIGAAGLFRETRLKIRHRAVVWGVWVRPECRGSGAGEAIMRRVIELAKTWDGVRQLNLSAGATQTPAVRLYERVGFVAWGVEPQMLCVDGRYYDEVYLQLRFE